MEHSENSAFFRRIGSISLKRPVVDGESGKRDSFLFTGEAWEGKEKRLPEDNRRIEIEIFRYRGTGGIRRHHDEK